MKIITILTSVKVMLIAPRRANSPGEWSKIFTGGSGMEDGRSYALQTIANAQNIP